jgi:hypothetical protein
MIRDKLPILTDYQLKMIMKDLNIHAELACKYGKRIDTKDAKFKAPNLIKRK